jgi:hypothetical protein
VGYWKNDSELATVLGVLGGFELQNVSVWAVFEVRGVIGNGTVVARLGEAYRIQRDLRLSYAGFGFRWPCQLSELHDSGSGQVGK